MEKRIVEAKKKISQFIGKLNTSGWRPNWQVEITTDFCGANQFCLQEWVVYPGPESDYWRDIVHEGDIPEVQLIELVSLLPPSTVITVIARHQIRANNLFPFMRFVTGT